uniref:Uncharacterized protein n=1 Tax=Lactuca sativa TaxID=4236 RepID=A0A9R1VY92_LACSA|nr:hypothetical protein LSAT_V11C300121470 [Lactuca sativa]
MTSSAPERFRRSDSAYVVGVAGWATGLKLDSDSVRTEYNTHRNIGIALFALLDSLLVNSISYMDAMWLEAPEQPRKYILHVSYLLNELND